MKSKLLFIVFTMLMTSIFYENAKAFLFWNQACSFSGASVSYIAFKDSASLDITSDFTIETWISPLNVTSPANQIILEKRAGTLANGYTLYLNNGRVAIRTNSITRLTGKTAIPNNTWTHIAGVYNAASNLFSVYINGILDTSATVSGAAPITNSDSLRIGKGNVNSPFAGYMDELRVWSKANVQTEIYQFRRTSLAASTGIYSQLVLSLTFQDKEPAGTDFTLFDWSGNNGTGRNNNVTGLDLSNRPSVTVSPNESAELDGADDYLTGTDNSNISPVSAITMEAWILPRDLSSVQIIFQKGTPFGPGINYSMRLFNGLLYCLINGNPNFLSAQPVTLNIWTHVAFTYDGATGKYFFYTNGLLTGQGSNPVGLITNGAENIFIGSNGTTGSNFNGFIDEVRISNYVKSGTDIQRYLYQSIENENEPNPGAINVVYNLDGYSFDNADNGPGLVFVNGARFSHTGAIDNQPVSPLLRENSINFSDGFNLKTSGKMIPDSTPPLNLTIDSIKVNLDTTVNDINVFVAINNTREEDLTIILEAPDGEQRVLYFSNILAPNSDNVVTIFDDQADSSLNNGRYVSFGPRIKPFVSLSPFIGNNTAGFWKLLIYDNNISGTGLSYSWGIQFNEVSMKIPALGLKVFTEGFYRPVDSCIADTFRVHLHEDIAPQLDVGIQDETPDEDNIIYVNFTEADFLSLYYIEVEHRNSIETWSAAPVAFDFLSGNLNYDFTVSQDAAFGSNQVQVEIVPEIYAIYSGDIDQNGLIDLNDVILAFNDASDFVAGYDASDVNGDNLADLTDVIITNNNSVNFIIRMRP
ncbi:MAG: proprotein convertase P-domain-containing protein [Ignavibacteria bacterium]|nr:proprotein convertase P-domain-containing protein [Ignavibacteria bacterium]